MSTPADPTRPLPKLGRRHTDKSRPVVRLSLTGTVPAHPASADHFAQVPAWNGATNINYGTCGPCSVANHAILTWKYLLGLDISVKDADIYDLYRRSGNPNFDPATDADDNGVDMTVMLSALVKGGIRITHADKSTEVVKPLCFASTAPSQADLEAVTAIMGAGLLAVDLDVAQQSQTDAGLWDYATGSGSWGGHAICGGKYTGSSAAHTADESVVTWQQVCGTTDSFIAHQLSELYVVVWPALWNTPAFVAGVDQAALAADYTALTGKPFPAPVPPAPTPPPAPVPPTPTPVPPAPSDPDVAYGSDARLIDWAAERHVAGNHYAAQQYTAWRQAKGYAS